MANIAPVAISQADRFNDPEFINSIKQTVAKGASDAQLRMFIEVCRSTGLNPFLKEIWYVAETGVIMAGRDGYLRVANEHPQFDGMETRVERNAQEQPVKATCTVWRKDRSHPIVCEAYYNEYRKASPVWQKYPSAMIGKVAEVLALKRSFSINGVVTEEEIGDEKSSREEAKQAAQAVAQTKIEVLRQIEGEVKEETRKGAISFKALASIGEQKKILHELTDSDAAYYAVLKNRRYEHANEILDDKEARAIYKELAETANREKERQRLMLLLAQACEAIGAERFWQILGQDFSCTSIDDALALGGTQLSRLLAALTAETNAVVEQRERETGVAG